MLLDGFGKGGHGCQPLAFVGLTIRCAAGSFCPMNDEWYSVRMRASRDGRHLSGAERIGQSPEVAGLVSLLTARAMAHAGGTPDDVRCTLEKLEVGAIASLSFPEVRTWQVEDWRCGRLLAVQLLIGAGLCAEVAGFCLQALANGPAPGGGPMRGAMIVDALSGERLDSDAARGVRVSHMDVSPEERTDVVAGLRQVGLSHYRVLEALILSGKVLQAPGLVAELCWSDDPDYLTGYVATPANGYQRISCLKERGSFCGGRVFLVDSRNWSRDAFVTFLEKTPVLLHGMPLVHPSEEWEP